MTSGFPVTKPFSALPAPFKWFKEVEQTEGNLFHNLFPTLETFRALHNSYNPAQVGGNEGPNIYRIGPALIQPSPTVVAPVYLSPSRALAYRSVVEHSEGIASLELNYGRCGFRATRPSTSSSSPSIVSAFPLGLEGGRLPSGDDRQSVAEAKLREFVCRLCGRDFKCALHLAQHHCPGIVQATYNCCECQKVFTCSANLASHQRWHRPKMSRPSLPIMKTTRLPSSALSFKHRRQTKQTKPPASPAYQQGNTVAKVTDFSIESLLRPDRKQQERRRSGNSWMHPADSPLLLPTQALWSQAGEPQKILTDCDQPSTCFCCGRVFHEVGDLEDHILDHVFLPTIC